MRNSSVRLVLITGTALILQISSAHAFPWPFGKKEKPAPSASELQSQEGLASELLNRAQAAQDGGKISAANSLYKQIVGKYPLTKSASTAQYFYAKNFEQSDPQKAFEEYQTLIDTYKASPYFTQALDSQFSIAKRARTDKLGSYVGLLKKKLGRADTLKLFKAVVQNAPQGKNAPEAKYEIGVIHEEGDERSEAINAYQDVVDQYGRSSFAAQAQKKIAELNFGKVVKGTKDAGALNESRDAAAQAVSLFPTEEARDLLPQIDEKQAESAFNIAKFYERTKNYKAAIIYYNKVLKVPGGNNFDAAKERVNELTMKDPTLLEQPNVNISNKQLALRAQADVKSRPDYLGPPAPVDLERSTKKPKMRTGSPGEAIVPLEEPALPGDKPAGKPDDSLLKPGGTDLSLPPVAPLAEPALPGVPAEPAPEAPAAPAPEAPAAPEAK